MLGEGQPGAEAQHRPHRDAVDLHGEVAAREAEAAHAIGLCHAGAAERCFDARPIGLGPGGGKRRERGQKCQCCLTHVDVPPLLGCGWAPANCAFPPPHRGTSEEGVVQPHRGIELRQIVAVHP